MKLKQVCILLSMSMVLNTLTPLTAMAEDYVPNGENVVSTEDTYLLDEELLDTTQVLTDGVPENTEGNIESMDASAPVENSPSVENVESVDSTVPAENNLVDESVGLIDSAVPVEIALSEEDLSTDVDSLKNDGDQITSEDEQQINQLVGMIDALPDPASLGSSPEEKSNVLKGNTHEKISDAKDLKDSLSAKALIYFEQNYGDKSLKLTQLESILNDALDSIETGVNFSVGVNSMDTGYQDLLSNGASEDEIKNYLDNNLPSLEETLAGWESDTTGKGSLTAYFVKPMSTSDYPAFPATVTNDARQQLKDARLALDKINAKNEVKEQTSNILEDVGVDAEVTYNPDGTVSPENIQSDDLDDEGKQQLADILNQLKEDIENASSQEEIEALIEQAKQDIDNIKTKYEKDKDAYMDQLNAQKSTFDNAVSNASNAATADDCQAIVDDLQSRYDTLKNAYDNLSPKAKALVDEAGGKNLLDSYKAQLDSAKGVLSEKRLNEQKAAAKNEFNQSIANLEKEIKDRADKLVKDGHEQKGPYDDAEQNTIDSIYANAYSAIEAIKNSASVIDTDPDLNSAKATLNNLLQQAQGVKNNAMNSFEAVNTIARKKADSLEEKIRSLGDPSGVTRNMASKISSLISEYQNMDSFLSNDRYRKYTGNKNPGKNMIEKDIITGSETYKQRLDACQARIDEMAQQDANNFQNQMNALPDPSNALLDSEGSINNARQVYNSLTPEAKAKVSSSALQKLNALEAKMVLEHYKEKAKKSLNDYAENKKLSATYDADGVADINKALKEGLSAITNSTSNAEVDNALNDAINKINAVKTVAQKLKEQGVQYSFNKMKFRVTKREKKAIYLRWEGVEDIAGFQIYGAKVGEPMRMLRQYDYKARSTKFGGLQKKTQYTFRIYAFKVVDGEIIKVYGSPAIYTATKGGKLGSIKSVKVTKVGKKKAKKNPKVKLRVGQTVKVKAKQNKDGSKVKKYHGIRYESSNPNVAVVRGNGRITGVSPGVCYVSVFAQSGAYKIIRVTVR